MVISQGRQHFKVQFGDRQDNITTEQLKPVFSESPVTSAVPKTRGRPKKTTSSKEDRNLPVKTTSARKDTSLPVKMTSPPKHRVSENSKRSTYSGF